MFRRRICAIVTLAAAWPFAMMAAKQKACVAAEEAAKMLNRDVWISAHVYDVVALPDGTRFLDVCAPETSDDACRFVVVSWREDSADVGELGRYRGADVEVRGIVRPMRGRAGMVLSHARQFHGGPPKFRPNPKLAHGFNAEQDRPPIQDPNLRAQGGVRSFMNSRDRETRVVK